MTIPLYLIVFALGAAIGSFINVVVYRLPAGLSILWPPSRCPHCLNRLGKKENIPVLGWLWLKGKCKHCRSQISPRYPIVEAFTGLIFLLVFSLFGLSLETVGYWFLVGWLLTLSLIDLDTMTLPNSLTQSGLVLGLVFQALLGWQNTSEISGVANQLMVGIGGAVLGMWLFEAIAWIGTIIFGQTAMGAGDAKLSATIGAWLGWKYLLLSSFIACGLGAFVGGGAIALGILSRKQPMPFGPFLALGGVLACFWGEAMLSAYLQIFFPSFN
ncbi:MAG: A24 family peptidase [Spirulinaceae cyanobacterium]